MVVYPNGVCFSIVNCTTVQLYFIKGLCLKIMLISSKFSLCRVLNLNTKEPAFSFFIWRAIILCYGLSQPVSWANSSPCNNKWKSKISWKMKQATIAQLVLWTLKFWGPRHIINSSSIRNIFYANPVNIIILK